MPWKYAEEPLFNPEPTAYLPHRYPFLLLDRILSREPGVSASALRQGTGNEQFFTPFLLVEGLAQLAGVATICEEGERGFLAAINHADFLSPHQAGDTLYFAVTVVKAFGRLFMLEGTVSAGDKLLVTASLTVGVGTL